MAMYENEGFCPNKSFGFYTGAVNPNWDATHELLGDKLGFMVYTPDGVSKEAYVVDLFMGGSSLLAYRLAVLMHEMDPDTKYAEHGKKILIRDLINQRQMPNDTKLYEDDRYLVGIRDSEAMIELFIYKK